MDIFLDKDNVGYNLASSITQRKPAHRQYVEGLSKD